MNRSKNCILAILLSSLLFVGQLACSNTVERKPVSNLSSLSEAKTGRLNVTIVPSEELPKINCITYDAGRGRAASEIAGKAAKKGALAGALFPIYAIVDDPQAVILVPLWPILIPAGAVGGAVFGGLGGAIAGAIKGDYREFPMEQAEEVKRVAAFALTVSNINKVLAEDLMKAGQTLTDYKYNLSTEDDFDMDTDIVLRVGISHLEFKGENEKDPDTRFKVRVDVVMEDAKKLNRHSDFFEYISKEHDLSEWLDNNGRLLQQEYENCYRILSANIIREMLVTNVHYIADLLTPKPLNDPVAAEQKLTPPDSNYQLAYAPETKKTVCLLLRNQPKTNLNETDIKNMLSRYGFFDTVRNPYGAFHNDFADNQNGTITDHATGLMWQKSGSSRSLKCSRAEKYIGSLNGESFAGYSDWRMPTIEELASLLKKDKDNNLHISSVFNYQQHRCWSSDRAAPMHGHGQATTAWVLDYDNGKARRANWYNRKGPGWEERYIQIPENYVRAVRSVE